MDNFVWQLEEGTAIFENKTNAPSHLDIQVCLIASRQNSVKISLLGQDQLMGIGDSKSGICQAKSTGSESVFPSTLQCDSYTEFSTEKFAERCFLGCRSHLPVFAMSSRGQTLRDRLARLCLESSWAQTHPHTQMPSREGTMENQSWFFP